MKRNLALVAALMTVAVTASAQGTVNFANNSSSLITADSVALTAAMGGRVQLAWAPAGVSLSAWTSSMTLESWLTANPSVSLAGAVANVGATPQPAGRFSGGARTLATATPGAVVQGVVFGWNGAYANFDAAFAAGIGGIQTVRVGLTTFTVDTGNPLATPSPETAANMYAPSGTFAGLNLVAPVVVPEPTSFALAGLGAAALLIFRRRS